MGFRNIIFTYALTHSLSTVFVKESKSGFQKLHQAQMSYLIKRPFCDFFFNFHSSSQPQIHHHLGVVQTHYNFIFIQFSQNDIKRQREGTEELNFTASNTIFTFPFSPPNAFWGKIIFLHNLTSRTSWRRGQRDRSVKSRWRWLVSHFAGSVCHFFMLLSPDEGLVNVPGFVVVAAGIALTTKSAPLKSVKLCHFFAAPCFPFPGPLCRSGPWVAVLLNGVYGPVVPSHLLWLLGSRVSFTATTVHPFKA